MKKKNSDFRLSADSEMKKEEKKVEKGTIIFSIAITVLVGIAGVIMVFFC